VPVRHRRVGVVEVGEERVEERVAVSDDRLLEAVEDLPGNALRVVVGLQQLQRNRPDQHRLADPSRAIPPEVTRHLAGPHREPHEHDVLVERE
jgi:hypothetical protein